MKDSWTSETLYADIELKLKVQKKLYSSNSSLQKIEFLKTYRFGTALIMDGAIQTTAEDEFIYHEMMSHIPLFSHPSPENIIIVGGGDGGILREVLKHKVVKKVTLVEIEEKVIEQTKEYLPQICKDAFKSKRLELVIADGAGLIKGKKKIYDIAIIDSPDPIGPAKVLFKNNFYRNISKILKNNGIMVRQSGSSFLQKEELKDNYKRLSKIFKYTDAYIVAIPTYIGGFFNLIFASDKINIKSLSLTVIKKRFLKTNIKTEYYNPEIHLASFKLPNYIKKLTGDRK
ncbi:MAG: polyamine aminopropyltransferase [Candidatus Kaelpia imicola]|nr:polyamine aminopropyltransferase [Candidatus Kaelpia imicola]